MNQTEAIAETTETEPISLAESKRLIELEKKIDEAKTAFLDVGTALAEIRDKRLYRLLYDNFEDYCQAKFGFSRQYAYNLIGAVEVVESLPANCKSVIDNERSARVLIQVPPAKRAEIIRKAKRKSSRYVSKKKFAGGLMAKEITAVLPKSMRRGGLAAEALAAKERKEIKVNGTPKKKMEAALDEWCEQNKEKIENELLPTRVMITVFRKLIDEAL